MIFLQPIIATTQERIEKLKIGMEKLQKKLEAKGLSEKIEQAKARSIREAAERRQSAVEEYPNRGRPMPTHETRHIPLQETRHRPTQETRQTENPPEKRYEERYEERIGTRHRENPEERHRKRPENIIEQTNAQAKAEELSIPSTKFSRSAYEKESTPGGVAAELMRRAAQYDAEAERLKAMIKRLVIENSSEEGGLSETSEEELYQLKQKRHEAKKAALAYIESALEIFESSESS